MNRIKNISKVVSSAYNKHTTTLNNFIDKYRLVKKIYIVGILGNIYLSYRGILKIIALSEVGNHLDEQLRRTLESEEKMDRKEI